MSSDMDTWKAVARIVKGTTSGKHAEAVAQIRGVLAEADPSSEPAPPEAEETTEEETEEAPARKRTGGKDRMRRGGRNR